MVANGTVQKHEYVKLDKEINLQKGHPIKSIQSEDGDIIDCIDIYKQPAFDHPALRNHKIQLNPSYNVKMEETEAGNNMYVGKNKSSHVTVTKQTWHKSGSCPKGTIPIRRIQKNNVSKGHSMHLHYDKQLNESKMVYLQLANHSLAILHTEGYAYIGAKGDIKVWNPPVEKDDEYTTSRVSLKSGPYYDYQAIESGWAADSSKKTGCFDLTCPGFVQTNNEIALGAAIYPISNPTGLPYQITVYIHKDPNTSNWWVQYGDRINIGYWPHDLFDVLRYHFTTVQWGGEVYSTRVGTHPHTSTGMGSGGFSDFVFDNSGYVKRMRVLENNLILRFPQWVNSYADEYECYDTYYLSDYVEEPEFYYGGPGRNPSSLKISSVLGEKRFDLGIWDMGYSGDLYDIVGDS
ncbi:hypothetical protein DH2020_049414 [Rehmannia glutinosa]|uniref:Neprosin PEP catalytic domain-containing protein n=1 Tax=Rehmannia glutinosa TaxID=99300 RepID=A0ABR0U2X7_REHGL